MKCKMKNEQLDELIEREDTHTIDNERKAMFTILQAMMD